MTWLLLATLACAAPKATPTPKPVAIEPIEAVTIQVAQREQVETEVRLESFKLFNAMVWQRMYSKYGLREADLWTLDTGTYKLIYAGPRNVSAAAGVDNGNAR